MRIDIVSLFPEMMQALNYGIPHRAQQKNLLQLELWNPRDFTHDRHRNVDDRPYGGGPGMVMLFEPLKETIDAVKLATTTPAPVIYLSPQGSVLNQASIQKLSEQPRLILLSGRYEGIDERLLQTEVDAEYSIGDYVLSGGELPAMVLIDAISRLIPGVLGDAESAQQDSFSHGLLDCPHFTRPEIVAGLAVPPVLLSGDHKAITRWRLKQALGRTLQRRPDLLEKTQLTPLEQILLDEFLSEQ